MCDACDGYSSFERSASEESIRQQLRHERRRAADVEQHVRVCGVRESSARTECGRPRMEWSRLLGAA